MNTYIVNGMSIDSPDELTKEEQQEAFEILSKQIAESQQPDTPPPPSPVEQKDEVLLKATEYDDLFEEFGKKYDLSPALLKAIAKTESDFDPNAKGESGELGMMQLMPLIRNSYGVKNPLDPRENIEGSAKFLSTLQKKYGDDFDKIVQAYNGGETLIDKQGGNQQTAIYRDKVLSYMPQAATPQQQTKQPIPGVSQPPDTTVDLEIKYDELYKNDDYFDRIQDYMIARFDKKGNQQQGETREEYVRRFANHMRHVEYNNIDLSQELLWTNSANVDDRTAAGFAFTLWDSIPIIDGGYNKFEAFADVGQALVTDITSYMGLGVGKLFSLAGSKTALKLSKDVLKQKAQDALLKDPAKKKLSKEKLDSLEGDLKRFVSRQKLKAMGVGAAVEGAVGAYGAGLAEDLAIQQYRKETFDYTNIALGAAVGTVFGGISARADALGIPVLSKRLTKELDQSEKTIKEFTKNIEKGVALKTKNPQEKEIVDLLAKSDKELSEVFDDVDGRFQIDSLSPKQKDIFQTQVKTKLYPVTVKIAGHIMLNDLKKYGPKVVTKYQVLKKGDRKLIETFSTKEEAENFLKGKGTDFRIKESSAMQLIGEAVNDVIGKLDKIDALTVKDAARKAGIDAETYTKRVKEDLIDKLAKYNITPKQMSEMMGTTLSDSAKTMQPYSYVSKIYNKMVGQDPTSMEFIEKLTQQQYNPGIFSRVLSGFRGLERESKVWVTSAISTTNVNVMGTTTGLAFGSAAKLFESLFQKTVRGIAVPLGADPKILNVAESIKPGDALLEWSKMSNYGLTTLEADEILKFDPAIRDTLTNTLMVGETGREEISRFGRFLSTLNLAQDTFFRKAIFTSSVNRYLKATGKDLYKDYISKDIPIPEDILKAATKEAMQGTFTRQFNDVGFGDKSGLIPFQPEAAGETLAHYFIKTFENIPTLSVIAPFPRFMANAINFQYRYSPIGSLSGVQDMTKALIGKNMDVRDRQILYAKGSKAFSEGVVGSSVLTAAYMYRDMEDENGVKINQQDTWDNFRTTLPFVDTDEANVFNMKAFFPAAPYFAVGDFIARSDNAKDKGTDMPSTEGIEEAIAGMKAKDVKLFPIVGKLLDAVREGAPAEVLSRYLSEGLFDFTGRFLQPTKPFREFFEGMSSEGLVSRDPKDLPVDILLDSDKNAFLSQFNNQIKNKIPPHLLGNMYGKEDLEQAVQYFRLGPPTTAGGFFNNITGIKITPKRNKIEKEIIRLGMQPWKLYTPSGIRAYDNVIISNSMAQLERLVLPLIENDERYQRIPDEGKIIELKKMIKKSFELTKENFKRTGIDLRTGKVITNDQYKLIGYLQYKNLSGNEREFIARRYAEDQELNPEGKSLSETKQYADAVRRYRGISKAPRLMPMQQN